MIYYPHALQFPHTSTILNFKELNCYQQNILIKINSTLPPNPDYRLDYHFSLMEIIEDTLKNKDNLKNLNLIEFLMFVIRLRAISIGNTIHFSIEDADKKTKKINFDVYSLLNNVFNISNLITDFQYISENEVTVKLCWPSVLAEEVFLSSLTNNNTEKFLTSICEYVEFVKIKDNFFEFKSYTSSQKQKLFELLPLSVKNLIQTNVMELLKKTSETKLFDIEGFENYKLELYNATIQDIIRFLFAYDEQVFIKENLFLIKNGMSMQDIENLSPINKSLYINLLSENEASKETPVQ